MTPQRARLVADLALLLVVAGWGYTFVPVAWATAEWPAHAMTFVALRFWIALAAFLPWLLRRGRIRSAAARSSLRPGLLTGIAMLLGYGLQTEGMVHATPAVGGFLTGMSVVLVPVGARLLGRPVPPAAVAGVVVATAGLAVFRFRPDAAFAFGRGEALILACAVAFAVQILLTDRFARTVDPVAFAAVQCAVTAVVATVAALGEIAAHGWPGAPSGRLWYAAAFCGVLGTTVSFLVQTVAQRSTPATHVALIFATEPVFAALASWLLTGERIDGPMIAGGVLILGGTLCAELGPRWQMRRRRRSS